MPQSIHDMFDALKEDLPRESEEDSDVAPMSPLVNAPTKQDLLKKELKKAERSV